MADSQDSNQFLKELMNDFKVEAAEHYDTIVQGLLQLEDADPASSATIIERVFRSTHSLKGASRAVNLTDIEKVCSSMETIFGLLKKGEINNSLQLSEYLYKLTDLLKELLLAIGDISKIVPSSRVNQAVKTINSFIKTPVKNIPVTTIKESTEIKQEPAPVATHLTSIDDSVRISTQYLNNILAQTEYFVTLRTTLEHYKSCLGDIYCKYKDDNIYELLRDLIAFQAESARMTDELTANIRSVLLSNFSLLFKGLHRMVKELAKEYDKEIEFEAKGADVEIDRRILEELKDPVLHIIRNCIDHGIEGKEERVLSGKSVSGKISLVVEKLIERKVRIVISDDGRGIDNIKVVESAIKNGVISKEESLSLNYKEIQRLILKSGVTSKKFVTDISGRGIGMSIAEEKMISLGGTMDISSESGKGTNFILTLPQTISTFRGVLIKSEKQHLVIPSKFIKKVVIKGKENIGNVGNKKIFRNENGSAFDLFRLSDLIGIEKSVQSGKASQNYNIMIISHNNTDIAIIVDDIFEENEGILKGMGPQLQYVKYIAGVTIIKNGVVVPVVNVKELIKDSTSAVQPINEPIFSSGTENSDDSPTVKVLIAEDSITIRHALKNYIESAGYQVTTAIDGVDAMKKLKETRFDIVVSDIEMPHMNGFELTRQIRSNSEIAETPVILVTALESAVDMKKGMDAGADAYIVKSSFEKSNLIDTINRLK